MYVVFSLLTFFRSKAGMFFKYFSEHLSEVTKSGASEPQTATETNKSRESIQNSLPVHHSSVQRVELIDLLTDVAGVLREKFQSKQYFNLCYSVNEKSKRIFIDLLPVIN